MQAEAKAGMIRLPLSPYRDDSRTIMLQKSVEGRRMWVAGGNLLIEDTGMNRRKVIDLFPQVTFVSTDVGPKATQPLHAREMFTYVQKTAPYAHQMRALEAARRKRHFALFMEQGTGKTKVALDRLGELYGQNLIDAVLIVTKKGVHSQWVNEQVPTHLGDQVPRIAEAWKGKRFGDAMFKKGIELRIATINIDALNAKTGYDQALAFCTAHKGRLAIVVDESQVIKNYAAGRTKACMKLAPFAFTRMILTGTPIAKDLCDEWSQFNFLDADIIGVKYVTSFRNQYCIMGGFENRQVIGVRNIEGFKKMVDPYSFRVTKEAELDLPPKVYANVVFEMSDIQKQHFKNMKTMFATKLDSGDVVAVKIAATCVLRLQQITCGMLPPAEEGGEITYLPNPRMDALKELLEQREGKAVIWARFNHDIETICHELGHEAVAYYGKTSTEDRQKAVADFLDPNSKVKYFVSNPSAGGTGLNLQGGGCRTVVYYSNSFASLDRWQSEDRTHRIGTTQTVTYFDLICAGSPDRKILANLQAKKSISDLALGELKELIYDVD